MQGTPLGSGVDAYVRTELIFSKHSLQTMTMKKTLMRTYGCAVALTAAAMAGGPMDFTYIAVQNAGSSDSSVTITWQGNVTASYTLPPGAARQTLLPNFDLPKASSVTVESQEQVVVAIVQSQSGESALYLGQSPKYRFAEAAPLNQNSTITVYNPQNQAGFVNPQYSNGSATTRFDLAPNGLVAFSPGTDVAANWTGSAFIESDVPIIGIVNSSLAPGGVSQFLYNAFPVTPGTPLVFPELQQTSEHSTFFQLQNMGGGSTEVTVNYFQKDGMLAATETYNAVYDQPLNFSAPSSFRQGSAVITCKMGLLAGVVSTVWSGQQQLAYVGLPRTEPTQQAFAPVVLNQYAGLNTSLCVANTASDAPAQVSVKYFANSEAGSTPLPVKDVLIPPQGSVSLPPPDTLPGDAWGSAIIESTKPCAVLSVLAPVDPSRRAVGSWVSGSSSSFFIGTKLYALLAPISSSLPDLSLQVRREGNSLIIRWNSLGEGWRYSLLASEDAHTFNLLEPQPPGMNNGTEVLIEIPPNTNPTFYEVKADKP